MRVIFVNPPSPFLLTDRGAPSLGILTLAAILRAHGHAVACWDQTGDVQYANLFGMATEIFLRERSWLHKAADAIPDEYCTGYPIWAITATSAQYHEAVNLLHAIKVRDPTAHVIIGGSHVSALPEDALREGFSAVFAGEADEALPLWITAGCPAGVIQAKAPRELDQLPFPARDLVDLPSYCADLTVGGGPSTTVLHSRGCCFACRYCVRTLGDAARLVRVRSPASILQEVDHLHRRYGQDRFVAVDDIWGLKRPWVERFCDMFGQTRFHFRVNCRANTLYGDLLPAMKRAGIDVISFGFESGSDDVLRAISKNNVALNTKAVQTCHDAGIAVKAYLIFGFAQDGPKSVEATQRWIEEACPDSAQCAWLVPLPGTPIYTEAVARGWTPAYHELYHNGKERRGSMNRLPWHTDETAAWYEELCQWLETFYGEPRPAVQCPHMLRSREITAAAVVHGAPAAAHRRGEGHAGLSDRL